MRHLRAFFGASLLVAGICPKPSCAQNALGPAATPTIQVTSRLVFLDVTVVNKKGRPVVDGLTKDDFTITEDKRPQKIFSFEAPQAHTAGSDDEGAPLTIFVLDRLNSSFEDFAFIRYSMRRFLDAQPARLNTPAEMMVIGNQYLELLQDRTQSKQELLHALDRLNAVIPYKWEADSFNGERLQQSMDALRQIALQNQGVPGRKNIVWVGHGSPNLDKRYLLEPSVNELEHYLHATTNLLVNTRVSLFVIYPGLKIGHFVNLSGKSPLSPAAADAQANDDRDNPFADDYNFGRFVNETGGRLFFNRNDVDAEIARSQGLGSQYYTLTYQPQDGDANGKFRRIRVILRNPNLQAVTKTGYYAPDKQAPIDPLQLKKIDLSEAARSVLPFEALDVKVSSVVRHPENHTASITLLLQSKGIDWQAGDNGKSVAGITVAAASLGPSRAALATNLQRLILKAPSQDPTHLASLVTRVPLTIAVPHKTKSIRVVVETADQGRMGTVDLERKAIDDAPAMPAPDPSLLCRRPCQVNP